LGCDPRSQLIVVAVVRRNITVPLNNAIAGKLAQTVFPGGEANLHSKPKLYNARIRRVVIGDVFPSRCNLC
jgi:hypothetical protein